MGKSTVGALVAQDAGACVLDLDSLTTALIEALGSALGLPADFDSAPLRDLREARYRVLADAAADNLRLGRDVVAIAPFTREIHDGALWRAWAAQCGAAEATLCRLTLPAEERAARILARGLPRDLAKVAGAPRQAGDAATPGHPTLTLDAGRSPAELAGTIFRVWRGGVEPGDGGSESARGSG